MASFANKVNRWACVSGYSYQPMADERLILGDGEVVAMRCSLTTSKATSSTPTPAPALTLSATPASTLRKLHFNVPQEPPCLELKGRMAQLHLVILNAM
jgi:hypothetical protein